MAEPWYIGCHRKARGSTDAGGFFGQAKSVVTLQTRGSAGAPTQQYQADAQSLGLRGCAQAVREPRPTNNRMSRLGQGA
jgi:hypothetical protein